MTGPGGERVLHGISAADGLVIGGVVVDVPAAPDGVSGANNETARPSFDAALAQAREELATLITGADELAGEILEFQEALLEDDDLLDPVKAAIAEGKTAAEAWSAHLDNEVAIYRSGDDAYLAARAEDLLDLKQRVLRALSGTSLATAEVAPGSILLAQDLTPSRFIEIDWSRVAGAAICGGSKTSHVAILARARGVPLVVGLQGDLSSVASGVQALLDADRGRLVIAPSPETCAGARKRMALHEEEVESAAALLEKPAVTAGGEPVSVQINVDEPSILNDISPDAVDGIGLTRTEFLFHQGRLPDEETQYAAYLRIAQWAGGRPVTIRTLDAGGDKPIAGVTVDGESNPFLGLRGLRLSLVRDKLFRTQLRALARAAAEAPLRVMVPMVTVPEEMERVRDLFDEVLADLGHEGVAHGHPPLGMMVEVPAAALMAEQFMADFYSIGSNDLVQYVTASARDNPALTALADPRNPAVLELIGRTVAAARKRQVDVSLCGDMASDPELVPLLLDSGLRSLSVAPAQVARVKLAVSRYGRPAGQEA